MSASQTQMSVMSKAKTVASEVKELSLSDGDEIPSDMEDQFEMEMGSSDSSDDIERESNLLDSQNQINQLMTPKPVVKALEMDSDDEISSENDQQIEVASESSQDEEIEDNNIQDAKPEEKSSNT